MRFRVTISAHMRFADGPLDIDAAREALSKAMNELNKLGSAPGNAGIQFDFSNGAVTFMCNVEADDAGSAIQPASDNIFLALREGAIGTPNWPDATDSLWRVENVSISYPELVTAS